MGLGCSDAPAMVDFRLRDDGGGGGFYRDGSGLGSEKGDAVSGRRIVYDSFDRKKKGKFEGFWKDFSNGK